MSANGRTARRSGTAARAALLTSILGCAFSVLPACKDDGAKKSGGDNPPPPPPPAASAMSNVCAGGGGEVKDSATASALPRTISGYCIDPNGDAMVYGDKEKHSMDEVCTKEFDGECEVYKRFGLKRVVSLRYVDGSGQPNNVQVLLDQFGDSGGAYAMFTTRVVAGGDPLRTTVKPLAAGGAAAVGSTNAYLWKGAYLLELNFVPEDPNMTKEQMAKAGQEICSSLAKAIGEKLPGTNAPLPAVAALPSANMLRLGVSYQPKDALGVSALGPAAIGYYQEGEKRYRAVVVVRDDLDQAKDALRALKSKPGALPVKDVGEEAVALMVQEAPDRAKSEYVFARKGDSLFGIGDEELVLKVGDEKAAAAKLTLTRDEKLAKLRAWVAATASPTPSPSGSNAPSPPQSAAPIPKPAASGASVTPVTPVASVAPSLTKHPSL